MHRPTRNTFIIHNVITPLPTPQRVRRCLFDSSPDPLLTLRGLRFGSELNCPHEIAIAWGCSLTLRRFVRSTPLRVWPSFSLPHPLVLACLLPIARSRCVWAVETRFWGRMSAASQTEAIRGWGVRDMGKTDKWKSMLHQSQRMSRIYTPVAQARACPSVPIPAHRTVFSCCFCAGVTKIVIPGHCCPEPMCCCPFWSG